MLEKELEMNDKTQEEKSKELTKYEQTRELMQSEKMMRQLSGILGNQQARAFASSVILEVSKSKRLKECEPSSIIRSAMRAAQLKLSCDPDTGQAYLVPFKDQCTLIVGYKGMEQLALRTEKYSDLAVNEIYDGQQVKTDQITGRLTVLGQALSDKVIGYVGYLRLLSGFQKAIYWSIEDIHKHAKRYSPSYSKQDGPWQTETPKMEKKTVLLDLLRKWGLIDPHDIMALNAYDDQVIDIELDEDGDFEFTTSSSEPEPEKKPVWPSAIVDHLVEKGIGGNKFQINNMLNKSCLDKNTAGPKEALAWSEVYRAERKKGKSSDEAAIVSNEWFEMQ
jgi:recombination protein RecT